MAYGFSPHFSCSGIVQTTVVLGDCPDHRRAQGLTRPPSCSGTDQTTLMLGTVPITLMLGDCPDHSSNIAWRQLSLATCDLYSHTVERHLFRPCYKAHTSPSSKFGDYIGTMHLLVLLVSPVRRLDSQFNWEFFLDPGTTCLCHLLPGSGTKWAHFTLR